VNRLHFAIGVAVTSDERYLVGGGRNVWGEFAAVRFARRHIVDARGRGRAAGLFGRCGLRYCKQGYVQELDYSSIARAKWAHTYVPCTYEYTE